jgi:hypothetical protein
MTCTGVTKQSQNELRVLNAFFRYPPSDRIIFNSTRIKLNSYKKYIVHMQSILQQLVEFSTLSYTSNCKV